MSDTYTSDSERDELAEAYRRQMLQEVKQDLETVRRVQTRFGYSCTVGVEAALSKIDRLLETDK